MGDPHRLPWQGQLSMESAVSFWPFQLLVFSKYIQATVTPGHYSSKPLPSFWPGLPDPSVI